MKFSRIAVALVITLPLIGVAWAANNFRLATSGGLTATFKSTDTGGVHVPHVNVDTMPVATSGGATPHSAIAPATPAGVNLKAAAGTLYGIQATTVQATPVYVKLYNSASAPTCGAGTPVARFMIPAAATAANGGGTNIPIPRVGVEFTLGIGYCVTGALADNDTTAITAANTLVNIQWK